MIMSLDGVTLLLAVHSLTAHSLIKIDLMAIKLGTIDAGEERLAINAYAARTAHTCTIDHQSVERHGCGQRILFGC